MSADKYVVILTIHCDDEDDDPRRWPFDDLLAAPEGEAPRFVNYDAGFKVER